MKTLNIEHRSLSYEFLEELLEADKDTIFQISILVVIPKQGLDRIMENYPEVSDFRNKLIDGYVGSLINPLRDYLVNNSEYCNIKGELFYIARMKTLQILSLAYKFPVIVKDLRNETNMFKGAAAQNSVSI